MKVSRKIRGASLLVCLCLLVGACACLASCGQRDTYRVAVFAYKFDDSYIATVRTSLEKYFKDYRKAKTAETMLTGLIEQGQNDLQYLETVADALDRASTQAEIEEIRNELSADGGAGAGLAILTGIAEIGDHSRDAAGAGTLEGVQQEAQLHQGLVGRGAGGLDDENIMATHAGADLNTQFAVAERGAESRREFATEMVADVHSQLGVSRTRDDFEVAVHSKAFLIEYPETAPPQGEAET